MKYKNGFMGGIILGFNFIVLLSLVSSFCVLRVNGSSSVVVEKQTSNQVGWHNVETWVLGVAPFGVVSVVKTIDYLSYLSSDNDVKRAIAKFARWVLEHLRKPREKTISKQRIERTAILNLKMLSFELSSTIMFRIASFATVIGIQIRSVVKFIFNIAKRRILFVFTIELQNTF